MSKKSNRVVLDSSVSEPLSVEESGSSINSRRHSLMDRIAPKKETDNSQLKRPLMALIMEEYPMAHLDHDSKPYDNELCLVFGDGLEGKLATYISAIDRFALCNTHLRLSQNPRKFIPVRSLDNEKRRHFLSNGA